MVSIVQYTPPFLCIRWDRCSCMICFRYGYISAMLFVLIYQARSEDRCTSKPTPTGFRAGADPGFFLGGGALVSCSTSTPINHIVFFFFLQNTSCIRKPHVISGGGAHPLHPPPRSAPAEGPCFCSSRI